jgi:anthranilate phosphoribosyltransferase
VLNAAAGFVVTGQAKSFREGAKCAEESIDSGKALGALENAKKAGKK